MGASEDICQPGLGKRGLQRWEAEQRRKKKTKAEYTAGGLLPPGTCLGVANSTCVLLSETIAGRGIIKSYNEERKVYIVDLSGLEGGLKDIEAEYLVQRKSLDTDDTDSDSSNEEDADGKVAHSNDPH